MEAKNYPSRKKVVMLVLPDLSGGGAERTSLNIQKYLDPNKFEVLLAPLQMRGNYLDSTFYQPKTVSTNSFFTWLSFKFKRDSLTRGFTQIFVLRTLIRRYQPDIVMTSMIDCSAPLACCWKLLPNIRKNTRWIVREGNNTSAVLNNAFSSNLKRTCIKKLITWTYQQSDHVIVTTDGVATELSHVFQIPNSMISVIQNPVDLEIINLAILKPPPENLPKRFIIAVGRLSWQKGFDVLLEAFARLRQNELDLVILGEGPEEQNLRQMCNALNIRNKVHFLGFLDNPWAVMHKAELFCFTSRWEGFGHVIVEAMACGTPVIASDCPFGPANIIKNSSNGVLVPRNAPNEIRGAIFDLINDSKKIESIKGAGFKRAKHFSAKKVTQDYARVFEVNKS